MLHRREDLEEKPDEKHENGGPAEQQEQQNPKGFLNGRSTCGLTSNSFPDEYSAKSHQNKNE